MAQITEQTVGHVERRTRDAAQCQPECDAWCRHVHARLHLGESLGCERPFGTQCPQRESRIANGAGHPQVVARAGSVTA